jgi:hypothetical protein
MSYQEIVSANKDSITLADGTTFKPINYRNHLKLYKDKNGNLNTNLEQFYNEYNGQFISNAAPLLIGMYVNTHDVTTSGGGGHPVARTTRSLSAASNMPNGHPGPGPVNTATESKSLDFPMSYKSSSGLYYVNSISNQVSSTFRIYEVPSTH